MAIICPLLFISLLLLTALSAVQSQNTETDLELVQIVGDYIENLIDDQFYTYTIVFIAISTR